MLKETRDIFHNPFDPTMHERKPKLLSHVIWENGPKDILEEICASVPMWKQYPDALSKSAWNE
jgi:hypothetical protein